MFFDLLCSLAIFAVVTIGLAWPLAERLPLAPVEKLVASVALSLLGVFLFSWAVYVFAWPSAALWLLPWLSLAGLVVGRRHLAESWRDADARALLVSQLLVTGWCLGWMATIASYSGGGWAADWFEHWERARFFLERWPLERKFLLSYPLTARPPLANVVTGAFLHLTRVDFAHYQCVTTLLSSLAFLPAALLARRWGGPRAVAVLAGLFLVNPLFVQNAAFAWTKLATAFFVLTALYFYLRAWEPGTPLAFAALWSACLAAGLLSHYSAGPYAVPMAIAWLALGWPRRRERTWWRATGLAALAGGLVLATWFAWALAHYGAAGTFLTSTTTTSRDAHLGNQLVRIALNLRDTLVPHFLRDTDAAFIAQRSPWGWWRDWFFLSYQLNLLFAFGSLGWVALLVGLRCTARTVPLGTRVFWLWLITAATVLGVATVGSRDHWGLAHICLQALVLLGLAFLAARWTEFGRGWRLALIAGATVDALAGIGLQFGAQSYALDRWLAAGRPAEDTLHSYSEAAFTNLAAKIVNQLEFFRDWIGSAITVVPVLLATLLFLALGRAGRVPPHAP